MNGIRGGLRIVFERLVLGGGGKRGFGASRR